nr:VOC family protein [Pacificimonas pallii]
MDHVQLAMPQGGEEEARAFYVGALGLAEEEKPDALKAGGGCWFRGGTAHIHLGVDPDFRAARKAHPAMIVSDLDALAARLVARGFEAKFDDRLPGRRRAFTFDPFGNRIELMAG